MTDTPNVLLNYIHLHHSNNPKQCLWLSRHTLNASLYLSKRADTAHAFTITELSEANEFIQALAKDKLWVRITPINCATVDCFTDEMKRVLNLA